MVGKNYSVSARFETASACPVRLNLEMDGASAEQFVEMLRSLQFTSKPGKLLVSASGGQAIVKLGQTDTAA